MSIEGGNEDESKGFDCLVCGRAYCITNHQSMQDNHLCLWWVLNPECISGFTDRLGWVEYLESTFPHVLKNWCFVNGQNSDEFSKRIVYSSLAVW